MGGGDRRWVTAGDGVRLAVRVHGPPGAPVLVCVHGYPDNSSLWDGVVTELAGRFRVAVYDVRGAGESGKPKERAAYRLDRLASDLAAVVTEVCPSDKVHLLGHDWGSLQAWHAVTGDALAGRVASYTSISGPSLDHAAYWLRAQLRPRPRALAAGLRQLLRSGYIGFFQLPLLPELLWRTGLMRRIIAAVEPAEAPETSDGLHGLQLYRANMPRVLANPTPRKADLPVQVLAPAGDRFITTPLQTEVQRWVPDLRIRRLTGGHWLPRTHPAVVARTVRELITHVDGEPEARGLRAARVPKPRRHTGSLVVITGAGSGIGRASALAFARQGADVVIGDIDRSAARETVRQVQAEGVQAASYPVDVAKSGEVSAFAAMVHAEHGVPDVVVNNAGIGMAGAFLHTSMADWEHVIDVNLWGVIHGCRAFAAQLVERGEGGHIVNVASSAAYLPSRALPAYSTTKAAVLMLSQCLRAELAGERIGVSAICPGFVRTNITSTARFVGLDAEQQAERRRFTTRMYARRNFGPDRVARDILRAVERDTALAPSTPEAHAALAMSRLTPGLLRAAARLDPLH